MNIRSKILQDLVSLFYPEVCCGCHTPLVNNEKLMCIQCRFDLPKTEFHKLTENPIERIFTGKYPLSKATAYLHFVKGGIVQSLLHNLKYKNHPEVGFELGAMAGKELIHDFFLAVDLLIPIPLHAKKQRKRGYNQSERIASGLGSILDIPVKSESLQRVTHSSSQTRKSRFDRWMNVEKVFQVNDGVELEGKHLVLIDDVITTGSTIEAAVLALKNIRGVQISLFTLAHA